MSGRGKTPKGWYSADVMWWLDGRKMPIAYSTRTTSDLIGLLSQDGYLTIQELHDTLNFCEEGKLVLQEFIKRGYGNELARDWFKPWG